MTICEGNDLFLQFLNTLWTQKIINSAGLFLDIIGAWFIASEVVNQYKGLARYGGLTADNNTGNVEETDDYQRWELQKISRMNTGLVLLTIGFVLQIISNFMP